MVCVHENLQAQPDISASDETKTASKAKHCLSWRLAPLKNLAQKQRKINRAGRVGTESQILKVRWRNERSGIVEPR
jgi:hypothetical protein